MIDEEKKAYVQALCQPDVIDSGVLNALLKAAEAVILNRLYPFGSTATAVPDQYATLQCEIAVEMYAKRGAEGQTSHSENGISRGWESAGISSSLLRRIVPMVGSVKSNA